MIPWLEGTAPFPPATSALTDPNGLLCAGGDLSPQRLLDAYRYGIFPWYSAGEPILWWSPDPRMVLPPTGMKISRSLRKTLRNADYEVRLDTAFEQVIAACAITPRSGQSGTWIVPEMQRAYLRLHALGHAHSVETWIDGRLAGGLYGVAVGRAFCGESMFSHRTDASKIALAHLCAFLSGRGFGIIDCQMQTTHLASLGARPISRTDYLAQLALLANGTNASDPPGRWPSGAVTNVFRADAHSADRPLPASGREQSP